MKTLIETVREYNPRMSPLGLVTCLILCTVTLGLPNEARGQEPNSNSVINESIEYYVQTDKAVYYPSESVEILYRVTNLREEAVTFYFADSQQYDFVVEKEIDGDFTEIWRWSWFFGAWQFPTEFTLQPSESIEFQEIWPQIDGQGTPADDADDTRATLGTYRIRGFLAGYEPTSAVSVEIEIARLAPLLNPLGKLVVGLALAGLGVYGIVGRKLKVSSRAARP